MGEVILDGISVPAFNAVRFLILSVVLIPLFEAAVSRFFCITCAIHILKGGCAYWKESSLGYMAMHGKYYSTWSRLSLYSISVAAISMYLLLEYGSAAVPRPVNSNVEVRSTTKLKPGNLDSPEKLKFVREKVDVASTIDFYQASLSLQGQRSVPFDIESLPEIENVTSPRPWLLLDVNNLTDYCFSNNAKSYNSTLEEDVLESAYQRDGYYNHVIESEYNVSSLFQDMNLGRTDSVLFNEGAGERAKDFRVRLYSVQTDLRVAESIYFEKGKTARSEDEFVRRFRSKGIRTTLRKSLYTMRSAFGYVSISQNKIFRCLMEGHGWDGDTVICRMSLTVDSDGADNIPGLVKQGGKRWDPRCEGHDTDAESGNCLTLLLRGTSLSKYAYDNNNTSNSSGLGLLDAILIEVIGSLEYNGNCSNNEYSDLLASMDASFFYILNKGKTSSIVSLDTIRRMVVWPTVFSLSENAFLKEEFESVNIPLSTILAPTISWTFIGITSALVAVIVVERALMLSLNIFRRHDDFIPCWVRLLVRARGMRVQSSFDYAAKKAFEQMRNCDSCVASRDSEINLHLQKRSDDYYVTLSGANPQIWNGSATVAGRI